MKRDSAKWLVGGRCHGIKVWFTRRELYWYGFTYEAVGEDTGAVYVFTFALTKTFAC